MRAEPLLSARILQTIIDRIALPITMFIAHAGKYINTKIVNNTLVRLWDTSRAK